MERLNRLSCGRAPPRRRRPRRASRHRHLADARRPGEQPQRPLAVVEQHPPPPQRAPPRPSSFWPSMQPSSAPRRSAIVARRSSVLPTSASSASCSSCASCASITAFFFAAACCPPSARAGATRRRRRRLLRHLAAAVARRLGHTGTTSALAPMRMPRGGADGRPHENSVLGRAAKSGRASRADFLDEIGGGGCLLCLGGGDAVVPRPRAIGRPRLQARAQRARNFVILGDIGVGPVRQAACSRPQNLEIEVVTERSVRLRTRAWTAPSDRSIYLSDAAPILRELRRSAAAGPSDCGRCGRDHLLRAGTGSGRRRRRPVRGGNGPHALERRRTRPRRVRKCGGRRRRARARRADVVTKAGWKERHAPRAPDCGRATRCRRRRRAGARRPAISWGKAGDNGGRWSTARSARRCRYVGDHFKSDEERWWVNMLSGRAARRGGHSKPIV